MKHYACTIFMALLIYFFAPLWLFVVASILSLLCFWYSRIRHLAFILWFSWAYIFCFTAIYLGGVLPPERYKVPTDVEGQVLSIERHTPTYMQIKVRLISLDAAPFKALVILSLYHMNLEPQVGETWRFRVKLKPIRGFVNLNQSSRALKSLVQSVRYHGYITNGTKLSAAHGLYITRVRLWLKHQFGALLSKDDTYGILLSLALGFRQNIPQFQWKLFRDTGTSHLMAISGLHIGLIALLFSYLGNIFWRIFPWGLKRHSAQSVGYFASMMGCSLYAAITGFSIPTQRAWVMVILYCLSRLFALNVSASEFLAIAFIVIFLINPLSLLSVSFYLSFGCVFLLFVLYQKRGFIGLFWMQCYLSLMMIPVGLYLFSYASISAFLANIVAIPIMMYWVVPLCFLGLFLFLGSITAAKFCLNLASTGVGSMLWYLSLLQQYFYFGIQKAAPTIVGLGCALLAIYLLFTPAVLKLKRFAWCFGLPLIFPAATTIPFGIFNLSILDVGQGLSVLVQTQRHAVLYDTGARWQSGLDAGAFVIIPVLKAMHIKQLDKIIISHTDNDHIGGLGSLLKIYTPTYLASPRGLVRSKGLWQYAREDCLHDKTWDYDGVTFRYFRATKSYKKKNNQSCVLKITDKRGISVLLPGDIEEKRERRLVSAYGKTLQSDFLIAPHHGSKTSSSNAFISAVSPKYVFYSVGFLNRYHQPHRTIVERYHGVVQYSTDSSGMIQLSSQYPDELKTYRAHLTAPKRAVLSQNILARVVSSDRLQNKP